MKHSVVIPLFARKKEEIALTVKCIQSMRAKQNDDCEILIIDDGSTEDLIELYNHADLVVEHPSDNRGIAVRWNEGYRLAQGSYITICNNDIIIETDKWLDKLAEPLIKDKSVGAVCPIDTIHYKPESDCVIEDYYWFAGYCFTIRNDIHLRIEPPTLGCLFDEIFVPFNFEDTDLWHRLRAEKLKLIKNHCVRIKHLEGVTVSNMEMDSSSNHKRFIQKWGFCPQVTYYPTNYKLVKHPKQVKKRLSDALKEIKL